MGKEQEEAGEPADPEASLAPMKEKEGRRSARRNKSAEGRQGLLCASKEISTSLEGSFEPRSSTKRGPASQE